MGSRRPREALPNSPCPYSEGRADSAGPLVADSGMMQSKLAVQVPFCIGCAFAVEVHRARPGAQLGNR